MPLRKSALLLGILLFIYALALLYPSGLFPLKESTEARYAEMGREMLTSGNLLEPTLDGVKRFHKPPLAFWAIAAGLKIFGINEFAARFFSIIAGILSLIALYWLARIFLDPEGALQSTAILATALLFLVMTRVASTDIYLTLFVVAAQYSLMRQVYGAKSSLNALLYGLFLGLGFLAKGHIVFLFTLLPYLIAKIFDTHHRKVFTAKEVAIAAVAFCLVGLPWYILVVVENPGLLNYFLKVQTADRFATTRFYREEPVWFFVATFFVTFAPWAFFVLKGAFKVRGMPTPYRVLLLYIAVPLLVFTLSKSKLATYILPFYGVASILAAYTIRTYPTSFLRLASAVMLTSLSIAFGAAGLFYKPLAPVAHMCAGFGSIMLVASLVLWRVALTEQFTYAAALVILLFSLFGYTTAPAMEPEIRTFRKMAAEINRVDPQKRLELVVYRTYLPSLSFYRGKLSVMALAREKDVQFEDDLAFKEHYVTSVDELRSLLGQKREVLLVADKRDAGEFELQLGFSCNLIFSQKKESAYLCARTN
jgi:4-amino-4-deoxy-L-arabinose transferase-like glycosyltransferase